MNSLALGSCIGACSEKLQDSIQSYIATNPDEAVTEHMTDRLGLGLGQITFPVLPSSSLSIPPCPSLSVPLHSPSLSFPVLP